MYKFAFLVLVFSFFGCAMTYEAPFQPGNSEVVVEFSDDVDAFVNRVKRELVLSGYQIRLIDSGLISTDYKFVKLMPEKASCGKTMGLDYLKDNRTKTEVAYTVLAEQGRATIKADIRGEYKPGRADQDITLTCYSTGLLERSLADGL